MAVTRTCSIILNCLHVAAVPSVQHIHHSQLHLFVIVQQSGFFVFFLIVYTVLNRLAQTKTALLSGKADSGVLFFRNNLIFIQTALQKKGKLWFASDKRFPPLQSASCLAARIKRFLPTGKKLLFCLPPLSPFHRRSRCLESTLMSCGSLIQFETQTLTGRNIRFTFPNLI